MLKEDLIEKSPMRKLEKALGGGLAAGEVGVVTSKKVWEKHLFWFSLVWINSYRTNLLFIYRSVSM